MFNRQSMLDYGKPLEPTSLEIPTPTGSEILLKISHCGVCHSDIHIQDGFFNLGEGKELDVRAGRELPFTLGHEIAGTVEAIGADVTGINTDQSFAVYPWMGCGDCARCKAGDEHLCNVTDHLGITIDGGYATHLLVRDKRYLFDIAGIDPALAGSLMCSGITAYSALKKAESYLANGPLMIVGLGGVGMMGVQIAKAIFDCDIIAADINPEKRSVAESLGVKHTFDPADKDARKAVFKTCGAADAAVDFVGADASLNFAQSIVGKAGAVVVAGLLGGKFSMPVPMFPLRQLAILGTFVGSLNDARELFALAASGKLSPIPIELRELDKANEALDDLRAGNVTGRIVLTP